MGKWEDGKEWRQGRSERAKKEKEKEEEEETF